jgi:NDP-sugar pyrophosphorylase family protein
MPKALLPLGNIPMVEYSLRMIEREGFSEVIVVAQESVAKVRNVLTPCSRNNLPLRFDVHLADNLAM